MPVPSSLYLQLKNDSFLLNHSDTQSAKTGIISLPEGPLLVSALPILTSQEQGPIRGTLLFGRWLDAAEIVRLGQTTHLTLALRRLDDPAMPAD